LPDQRWPHCTFEQVTALRRAVASADDDVRVYFRLAVGPVPAGAESVRRRAESVLEQVNDAERRLAEAAAAG